MFDLSHISYLAFLAPFALFFQQARSWLSQCFSFLIRNEKVQIVGDRQYQFINFMQKRLREIKFGNSIYKNDWTYHKKYNTSFNSLFVFRKKYIFLYKNFIPVIITPTSKGLNCFYINLFVDFNKLICEYEQYNHDLEMKSLANNNLQSPQGGGFALYEVRGSSSKTSSIKLTTQNSTSAPSDTTKGSFEGSATDHEGLDLCSYTYKYLSVTPHIGGLNDNDIGFIPPTNKQKSKYYFSEEASRILNEVSNWLGARTWYNERQIRWYRGCCLHGRPGLGKSALILEIARKLHLPIFIFDLKTMDNEEFGYEIDKICSLPGIILFEDFDAVFHGRTNLCKSKMFEGLSFDCFLNKLSGVNGIKNHFVFITTNHLEKLDPALLRAGRLDSQIELKHLDKQGKMFIAEKMLDLWPDVMYSVVTDEEETAAEFENKCTQLALDLYWRDKKQLNK